MIERDLSKRDVKRIVKRLRKCLRATFPVKQYSDHYWYWNSVSSSNTSSQTSLHLYWTPMLGVQELDSQRDLIDECSDVAKRDAELEKHRKALGLPSSWECSLILSKDSGPTQAEALIDPEGNTWRREQQSHQESELIEVYEAPVEFRGKRVETITCDDDSTFIWREGSWREGSWVDVLK